MEVIDQVWSSFNISYGNLDSVVFLGENNAELKRVTDGFCGVRQYSSRSKNTTESICESIWCTCLGLVVDERLYPLMLLQGSIN